VPPAASPPANGRGQSASSPLGKGGTTADCTAVSGGYRACTVFAQTSAAFHRLGAGEVSRIERRDGSGWHVVLTPRSAPFPGHVWWPRVLRDPRGKTLLAQWSGECEVPSTYLITTGPLTLLPVFRSHPATAVGWTSEGLARVKLLAPVYASKTRIARRPGIYLVSPKGHVVRLEKRLPAGRGCQ
jgi:hypothetical protein